MMEKELSYISGKGYVPEAQPEMAQTGHKISLTLPGLKKLHRLQVRMRSSYVWSSCLR